MILQKWVKNSNLYGTPDIIVSWSKRALETAQLFSKELK